MAFAYDQSGASFRNPCSDPFRYHEHSYASVDATSSGASIYCRSSDTLAPHSAGQAAFSTYWVYYCAKSAHSNFQNAAPAVQQYIFAYASKPTKNEALSTLQQNLLQAQRFQQLPRLLRLPTCFNYNAHEALLDDGRPLTRALFWDEFNSGTVVFQDGFYHCRDWRTHHELARHLTTAVDYFSYTTPAIVAEYLGKGAKERKELFPVRPGAATLLSVAFGEASAGYLLVQADRACGEKVRDSAPWVGVCGQIRSIYGAQQLYSTLFQLRGTHFGSSADLLVIQLERLPDDAIFGSAVDFGAFSGYYADELGFLLNSDTKSHVELYRVSENASLQLEVTYYDAGLQRYVEAARRISDGAARVPNVQILLGTLYSGIEASESPAKESCRSSQAKSCQSPLGELHERAKALICSPQQVGNAIDTLKTMIGVMQQQGRIAPGPADAQLALASHVLNSSTALVQCCRRENAAMAACLTLLALVRAYEGRGRVLCCAASQEEAAELAAHAAAFGLSHRAVYYCGASGSAGRAETQKVSILLHNIIKYKLKDRQYVGRQLTDAQNDRAENIIAAGQFDAWAAGPECRALEQHELQNCGLVITAFNSIEKERFYGLRFTASFVFGADRLLEPECMLPVSYAPDHVVLMAAGSQETPKLFEQRLSSINLDRSLFKRLYDMGMLVFQANAELQPAKKFALVLPAPISSRNYSYSSFYRQSPDQQQRPPSNTTAVPASAQPSSHYANQPAKQPYRQQTQIPPSYSVGYKTVYYASQYVIPQAVQYANPYSVQPNSYLEVYPAIRQQTSFFWHVQTSEASRGCEPRRINIAEGYAVRNAVQTLAGRLHFAHDRITVLTLYPEQATLLRQFLKQFPGVAVVEQSQFRSSTADAIIVSCVHSNEPFYRDFPDLMPLLQRAIQCAKYYFLLVGDAVHWSSADEEWMNFIFGCYELNKLFSGSSFAALRPFAARYLADELPTRTIPQPDMQQSADHVTLVQKTPHGYKARAKSTGGIKRPNHKLSGRPAREFVNYLLEEQSGSAKYGLSQMVSSQFLKRVSEKIDSCPDVMPSPSQKFVTPAQHFCALCSKPVAPGASAALLSCGHVAHQQCYDFMAEQRISCCQCRNIFK